MTETTVQLKHTGLEVDNGIYRSVSNERQIAVIIEQLKSVIINPVGLDGLYGRKKQGDVYSWAPIDSSTIGVISSKDVRYLTDGDKSAGLGKAVYDIENAVSLLAEDIPNNFSSQLYARSKTGQVKEWVNISDKLPMGIDHIRLAKEGNCPTTLAIKHYIEEQLGSVRIPSSRLTLDATPRTLDYSAGDTGRNNCTGKFIQCSTSGLENDKLVSVTLTRENNRDVQTGTSFMILMKKNGDEWIKVAVSRPTDITETEMDTTYVFNDPVSLDIPHYFYLMLSRSMDLPVNISEWMNIRLSANPAGSTHSFTGSGIYFNTDGQIHTNWSPRIKLVTDYYRPIILPGIVTNIYDLGNNNYLASEVHNDIVNNISDKGGFAEGRMTYAKGIAAHAEGLGHGTVMRRDRNGHEYNSGAIGDYSHSEGGSYVDTGAGVVYIVNSALGEGSHAEGGGTWAYGKLSHAEGGSSEAVGEGSHAEGYAACALGNYSHAEGYMTAAIGQYSHAEGKLNHSTGETIHSVGIGYVESSTGYPVNVSAHEIMTDGRHYIYGIGGYDGTSTTSTAKTLQDIVNGSDAFVNMIKNCDSLRYTLNRALLDDSFDDILRESKKSAAAIKTDGTSSTYSDALSLFQSNSVSKDIKRIEYSGDTSNYFALTQSKRANSLDRLFWYNTNTISSNYANSALIKELVYLDCSSSTSMCSTFELSMMTRVEKILPTINMTGATGMFYHEPNKSIDGKVITDNLVYLAGFDCSSLTEYCNFRPGWSGNWHPLADAFKNRQKISNLPIFRNLQISLRDGGVKYGNDFNNSASNTQFSNITSILGDTDTRTDEEKAQNIIEFFDSLGEANLRLVNPTTGNYDTNGVGVISFHPNVYDRIKSYVINNNEVRMALKYAMTRKNWMFFKNIDLNTREHLNFE